KNACEFSFSSLFWCFTYGKHPIVGRSDSNFRICRRLNIGLKINIAVLFGGKKPAFGGRGVGGIEKVGGIMRPRSTSM
ncbi:MAG TPA: hypothetical protein VGG44_01545, partial [Tepidisphaeraceae bacterium]